MSSNAKKINESIAATPQVPEYKWNNRIIVVEDEVAIANSYIDILETTTNVVPMIRSSRGAPAATPTTNQLLNFKLTICHNAMEALVEIKKARENGNPFAMGFFDVILGDGMDGIELVREIHKFEPDLYAVFVTAYNDRSIDSIHKLLGVDKASRWDYLNKPFYEGEIYQKARNFVTLWNLQKESQQKSQQLADLQKVVFESEKLTAVSAVARGVTHEFGNILMQITGRAEMSRTQPADQMKTALDKILEACSRAADILDRFKNLSEPSGTVSALQETSINKLLDDALDLMEHQLKIHNIKATKVKNDRVIARIHSTPILQVLVNLTINAIHAMPSSGQLDYSIVDGTENFEIIVRDYGTGIPDDLIEKVLQPFFTTKGRNGTGLGLSICKEIVEVEHQGKFTLRNNNVKGLEVVIQIPKNLKG